MAEPPNELRADSLAGCRACTGLGSGRGAGRVELARAGPGRVGMGSVRFGWVGCRGVGWGVVASSSCELDRVGSGWFGLTGRACELVCVRASASHPTPRNPTNPPHPHRKLNPTSPTQRTRAPAARLGGERARASSPHLCARVRSHRSFSCLHWTGRPPRVLCVLFLLWGLCVPCARRVLCMRCVRACLHALVPACVRACVRAYAGSLMRACVLASWPACERR